MKTPITLILIAFNFLAIGQKQTIRLIQLNRKRIDEGVVIYK